jgi:hypothetical protein
MDINLLAAALGQVGQNFLPWEATPFMFGEVLPACALVAFMGVCRKPSAIGQVSSEGVGPSL